MRAARRSGRFAARRSVRCTSSGWSRCSRSTRGSPRSWGAALGRRAGRHAHPVHERQRRLPRGAPHPQGKLLAYEPSVRLPLLMRGPGVPRGATQSQLVTNADLAPDDPRRRERTPGGAQDGRSLLELVGDPGVQWGRELLIEGGNHAGLTFSALRNYRWKYVEHATGELELYDLERDPEELASLHAEPDLAPLRSALSARLSALRSCAGRGCRAQPAAAPDARRRCRFITAVRGADARADRPGQVPGRRRRSAARRAGALPALAVTQAPRGSAARAPIPVRAACAWATAARDARPPRPRPACGLARRVLLSHHAVQVHAGEQPRRAPVAPTRADLRTLRAARTAGSAAGQAAARRRSSGRSAARRTSRASVRIRAYESHQSPSGRDGRGSRARTASFRSQRLPELLRSGWCRSAVPATRHVGVPRVGVDRSPTRPSPRSPQLGMKPVESSGGVEQAPAPCEGVREIEPEQS